MMAVQLNIPYETLIELVQQLPEEQRENLLHILSEQPKELSRWDVFRSMSLDLGAVQPGYTDHREDWYGDDGR
jgi:hypothetical protein